MTKIVVYHAILQNIKDLQFCCQSQEIRCSSSNLTMLFNILPLLLLGNTPYIYNKLNNTRVRCLKNSANFSYIN